MSAALISVAVLGALLLAAIAVIVVLLIRMQRNARSHDERVKKIRAAALRQSRGVQLGLISEQVAALLPGFRYNPKDVQWIGGSVDAVVWNGLEGGGEVEIVFLDVKTGRSRLTERQRRIREAIAWRRVAFDEYRPPEMTPVIEAAALELPDVSGLADEDMIDLAEQEVVGLAAADRADIDAKAPETTETG
jgi:hypothetical protein